MRDNPFLQNQRFAIASRISFAIFPTIDQLVALVMIHGLFHGDGRQFSRSISVIFSRRRASTSCSFLLFSGYSLTDPMVFLCSRETPSAPFWSHRNCHRSTPSFRTIR